MESFVNPIEKIENQLFDVELKQLVVQGENPIYHPPKAFGVYKTTGGPELGVVGNRFNITQPKALFDAFVGCIAGVRDIDPDKIQYQPTKGGAKIRFRVEVANFGFRNGVGRVDDINTYITLTTGYDGTTKTSLALECFRLICTNGMMVRGTSKFVGVKNVKGNSGKIESICDDFGKVTAKTSDIQEWFQHLNRVKVSEVKVQKVIKASFGFNRQTEGITVARLATLDQIEAAIAHEIAQSGGNLWGLLNGITQYTNHPEKWGGRAKSDMVDYLYQAGGARINERAQKAIAELA